MKYFFILYLFALLTQSVFGQTDSILQKQPDTLTRAATVDTCSMSQVTFDICDSLLCHASKHLGKPYKPKGTSPKSGFDCSGFVRYNFKRFNIELPRSSTEQVKIGTKVDTENALPGDLIFFKGRSLKSKNAGHVGIVVSKNERTIRFIHSAVTGGIRYDSTSSNYYKKRYLSIRRVINTASNIP